MKKIIEKAREWALEEIKTNGVPPQGLFELSNEKGQELASKLKCDKDIVLLGTILMDIKLGECFKKGKIMEHVARSVAAADEFLKGFNLSDEAKKRILNCVEAHHGTKEYICKEAEICANADCYRFLHPKGIFIYFNILGKRLKDLSEIMEQVESKMDEKHNILSLDICKQELEGYYQQFKKMFESARSM
ncbi:MAG: hypothetical protein KJ709_09285 [Nanoarchaeota archaeon]|nr:hypothetical protein [Nanoarchaeota archaeon]